MGGLLTALNAGKTSLSTNQKSIEIVGNNIANINTPGYSRQTAELTPIPTVNFGGFFVGQGVTISNVQRDYDVFINRQLQQKNINLGEESGRAPVLTELERIFSISDENIASEINRFFDSWQELTTNPSGVVERNIVIQRGQLLGDAFRSADEELDNVRLNLNNSILSKIDNLNEQLTQVAELNSRISLIEVSGPTANSARDQRDILAADLSKSLGIQTFTDNRGMLTVQLPGGLPLVNGSHSMTIETYNVGTDVNLRVRIGANTKDITNQDLGGEFKGMFDIRDAFLTGIRDDLDRLALDVTEAVNTEHVAGYGSDMVNGRDFFIDLGGVVANAARNVRMNFTDSTWVAAAGNAAAAPGDNENAQRVAELETTRFVSGTTDTFDGFFSKIVSSVGIEANRNDLAFTGAEDAVVQLNNLRDGFSGVSLEEEMINLIQFQRGFESSAKFLSTIDEMMDSLLGLKR